MRDLVDKIPEPWKIPETELNGVLYRVVKGEELFKDRDKVLFAVDSVLFEFRAYLELIARYVYGVLKGVDRAPSAQATVSSGGAIRIVTKKGDLRAHGFLLYLCDLLFVPVSWYDFLSEHRNFFTHEGAPYIAIEDLARPPEEGVSLVVGGERRSSSFYATCFLNKV